MTSNYVTIGNYFNTYEAHLARIRLESGGIFCRLLDENNHSLRKAIGYIIPVRLQVLEQDAKEAIYALSYKETIDLDDAELERQALEARVESETPS